MSGDEGRYRAMIEGIWVLQEWHLEDQILRPPRAVGRTIFLGGTVSLLMRYDAGERENHRYGLGRFVIEGDRLHYGYDQMFDYSRDVGGARSTPQAGAGKLRPYRLSMEAGCLVCTAETHGSRLLFAPERLEVYGEGRLLRTWSRHPHAGG